MPDLIETIHADVTVAIRIEPDGDYEVVSPVDLDLCPEVKAAVEQWKEDQAEQNEADKVEGQLRRGLDNERSRDLRGRI